MFPKLIRERKILGGKVKSQELLFPVAFISKIYKLNNQKKSDSRSKVKRK